MPPATVRCPNCDADVATAHRFCPECGSPVGLDSNTGTETVAIPQRPLTRTPASAASRISSGALLDEGRFIPGTLLAGRYRIISLLGRGGMGEVYRATDLTLAQSVALKFLPVAAAQNQSVLERFHNEVRVARQVSHPNVCRVYDIGEADGHPYLSMEYIDGEDLGTTLQRVGRLPADKALEITRKICAGLNAAHAKGVIHRDLKPANIMIDRRGEVSITDFGLAAVAESITGREARQGTPAYMSPEQLRGGEVTARSDIYALGLILYEVFTGKKPFDAKTLADLMRMQDTAHPASMSSLAEGIDPAVEQVVLRCLNPDAAKRPASALSVSAALPGSDPLAAALAAGETPSPELVAAAGEESCLTPRWALSLVIAVLAALVALPFSLEQRSVTKFAPLDYSPEVLEEKAREVARTFGYQEKPVDWHSRWIYNPDLMKFLGKLPGTKDWRQLLASESPIGLRYRQSPRQLEARPHGRVSDDRPPHTVSGMVRLTLDSAGRLRGFSAVPPQVDATADTRSAIDTASVFRALGFPTDGFSPAAPSYTPLTPFDARQAWSGKHPDIPAIDVTVEIAAWRGKITDVTLVWPWTLPTRLVEPERSIRNRFMTVGTAVLVAIALVTAFVFARRNYLAGRGDRAGAFRASCFVFVTSMISFVLATHFVPSATMFSFGTDFVAYSLYAAAIIWLLYMALEPAVRAGWPHALIAWNRLIAGRYADGRVGSDVLMGMAVAMLFLLAFVFESAYTAGQGEPPSERSLVGLNGMRHVLANVSELLENGVISAFGIFLLLFVFRRLLRRDIITAPVSAFLFTAAQIGSESVLTQAIAFLTYAILAYALMHFGLVTGIAAIVTINIAQQIVISTNFNAWYNSTGYFLWSVLVAAAIYAYWTTRRNAKQPA